MSGVSRTTQDTAGGLISGPGISTVLVNGKPICVQGDAVVGHGPALHGGPTTIATTSTVFAGGKPVVQAGDPATCGHPATGSDNVVIG